MRLLVIEDEKRLARNLAELLRRQGYTVDVSSDGVSGYDNASTDLYDLILLDAMLPGMDGFTLLRKLRTGGHAVPVLMLTARSDLSDRVQGLDCGADYYLTKPFEPEELLACVRSLLRRGGGDARTDDAITFGDLRLEPGTFQLSCGERSLRLSRREYDLLELLLRSQGRVVPKEQLLLKVWGYDSDAEDNNVEVYISFLRRKLAHLHSAVKIKTLRMLGSYIISWSIRLTTGRAICDPTSGMRMFNRAMVEEFAQNLNYGPEPDTISYLIKNGATVKEVQVEMGERLAGQSYLTFWRSVQYMVKMSISILLIQWFRKRDTETPYPERSL